MTMFNKVIKEFQWGDHKVRVETGGVTRQASGVVLFDMDDTVVLATVVGAENPGPGQDFLPLVVDYPEETYAVGKTPGGFFRRENRPSENEASTSCLIDRPLRPLFPEGSYNEVQIVIHVLSMNPEVPTDIPTLMVASTALAVLDLPFSDPVGAACVGYRDGRYLPNPNRTQFAHSDLDLVVASTGCAVLMVEPEAQQLSGEAVLGAAVYGHEQMQITISAIHELVCNDSKPEWGQQAAPKSGALVAKMPELGLADPQTAYQLHQRSARSQRLKEVYKSVATKLVEIGVEADGVEVDNTLSELESKIVRGQALSGGPRIDGRDTRMVRLIEIRSSVLPRAHGSALFTRGEMQALMVAALGTKGNEQIIDALQSEYRDRLMPYYNMPPFTMGETGHVDSPRRREVSRGRLARHTLIPVLSKDDKLIYTIHLVSEITESNGSSSMASVCGGPLALMDTGVSLRAYVVGVAMGLILKDSKFAVLTGILGDENHLGDMDFKVVGTDAGIIILQMDIKVQGITKEITQVALTQAEEGRLYTLGKMQATMDGICAESSEYAPCMITIKVNPEKIRDVTGKDGSTIQALTKETSCAIDIQEDGTIATASTSSEGMAEAKRRIEGITVEVEVGRIYSGMVLKLLGFGVIVNILPGKDGLLRISEIANGRVDQVSDYVKEGQTMRVKPLSTDERGHMRLSIKTAKAEGDDVPAAAPRAPGVGDIAS